MNNPIGPMFAWERAVLTSTLPAPSKLILLTLRTHTRPGKPICWPSIPALADKTSLSKSTIHRELKRLSAAAWLRIIPHTRAAALYSSCHIPAPHRARGNVYLLLPAPTAPRCHPDTPHSVTMTSGRHKGKTLPTRDLTASSFRRRQHSSPTSIAEILRESPHCYGQPDRAALITQLVERALALEQNPASAVMWWTKRIILIADKHQIPAFESLLNYAEDTQNEVVRTSKGLGRLDNPASWLNKHSALLLKSGPP